MFLTVETKFSALTIVPLILIERVSPSFSSLSVILIELPLIVTSAQVNGVVAPEVTDSHITFSRSAGTISLIVTL